MTLGVRQFQADFETFTRGGSGTSTSRRPDAVSTDYRMAFSPGPIDVDDLSDGLELWVWYCRTDGADVWIARENVTHDGWDAETLLFNNPGYALDEIDFAFDSTGKPVVCGERYYDGVDREVVLYWYDVGAVMYRFVAMGLGRTPKCVLDHFPHSPDPDICPPPENVQVVFMKTGTGLVRLQEDEDYAVENSSPLADDPNIYLEDIYPTEATRTLRVAYSIRDPGTGTYQLACLDSTPYPPGALAAPDFLESFYNLLTDQGSGWSSPGTTGHVDVWNLRVYLPDTVDEVQVAADDADFSIGTGWGLQTQVQNAVAILGPGNHWPAGGFLDFPFTITHGGGTYSPRAFRARTKKTISGHDCYSPWRYWFAGEVGRNLTVILGAEDSVNHVQAVTFRSLDSGFWVQNRGAFGDLQERYVGKGSPLASLGLTVQQIFDPSIGGGWRTPYRMSLQNIEPILFSDAHDTYSFDLRSQVAADAQSSVALAGIPGPPYGSTQTPQAVPSGPGYGTPWAFDWVGVGVIDLTDLNNAPRTYVLPVPQEATYFDPAPLGGVGFNLPAVVLVLGGTEVLVRVHGATVEAMFTQENVFGVLLLDSFGLLIGEPCTCLLTLFDDDGISPLWTVSTSRFHPRPYLVEPEKYQEQEIDVAAGRATLGTVSVTVIDPAQVPGDQDGGWTTERLALFGLANVKGHRCQLVRFIDTTLGYQVVADGPAGTPRMDASFAAFTWDIRDTRDTERKVRAFDGVLGASTSSTTPVIPGPAPTSPPPPVVPGGYGLDWDVVLTP